MTAAEVSEGLGLDTLKNRQWSIHKSCAIKGEGLEEGLDWSVADPSCNHATGCVVRSADSCPPHRLATALQNN